MAWADLRRGWEWLSESCTPQGDPVTCSTIQRRRVQSDCALPPFPPVAQESCGAECGVGAFRSSALGNAVCGQEESRPMPAIGSAVIIQSGCRWWSGGRALQRTLANGMRSVWHQVDATKTIENSWAEKCPGVGTVRGSEVNFSIPAPAMSAHVREGHRIFEKFACDRSFHFICWSLGIFRTLWFKEGAKDGIKLGLLLLAVPHSSLPSSRLSLFRLHPAQRR